MARASDAACAQLRKLRREVDALNRELAVCRRSAALLGMQQEVLQSIAAETALPESLDRLLASIECRAGGGVATMLVYDEAAGRLQFAAAPSLPDWWPGALADGLPLGPAGGLCGLAGQTRAAQYTTDIRRTRPGDPLRLLAERCQRRTCWALPIVAQGQLLAVLCLAFRGPRRICEADRLLAEVATQLAGLAIQRCRATEALRLNEERFRALVEHSFDAVTVVGETGHIRYWSPGATRMLGYQADELVHCSSFDIIHPDDHPLAQNRLARILAAPGNTQTMVVRLRHKNGQYRWVEIRGRNLLHHPAVRGLVVNGHDVTDRAMAEQRSLDSERRMAGIVNTAADAIFTLDETGRIETANPACRRLLGYKPEELIGRKLSDLVHELAGECPGDLLAQLKEYDGRSTLVHREVKLRRKDGEVIPADLSVGKISLEDRTLLTAIFHDLTHQKQLEDQVRQASKMEAIGRLAGGVAHDFNNLLTVITGYAELLLSQDSLPDPASEHLREIHFAARQAASLTRQLLAFSRRSVLAPKIVDLNEVVADSEKMIRRLIGEDIDLVTHLHPRLHRIKADTGHLSQVILNLVVNARDAMPTGGRLVLETANVLLDADHLQRHPEARRGPHVMLRVTDTGCGMDEKVLARIFEPFFTTKPAGKGTGLGLATVYGIVQQFNGHIAVESQPGRGTTFRIFFPRVEHKPRAADQAPRPADNGHARRGETILLVENEPSLRNLAQRVLTRAGYRVIAATGGRDALRLLPQQTCVDLLISDVVMPQIDGPQVAAELRRCFPAAKVLFISGYTDDQMIQRGILDQGSEFLAKPFTPSLLLARVREVLDAAAPSADNGRLCTAAPS